MNKSLRLLASVAVAMTVTATVGACGSDDSAGGSGGGETPTIGVSMAAPTIALYSGIQKGIKQEAAARGAKVIFTDAGGDAAKQANDINDLIARGVDGLLVSGIDADAMIAPLQSAKAADIPVMTVARDVEDTSARTSFIGNDWSASGKMIGEWTCKNVGTGKVAMIEGPSSAAYVQEMTKAYKAVVGQGACSGMKIAYEKNLDQLTADAGLKATQDALSAVPDLKVVYANLDDFLNGTIQAINEAGKSGDVTVTGFDGFPESLDLVKDGSLGYEIALRPKKWGKLSLDTMLGHLDGEKTPSSVTVDLLPFDKTNVDKVQASDVE